MVYAFLSNFNLDVTSLPSYKKGNTTLPETNSWHLPGCTIPQGKNQSSNHPFSGILGVVSGRVQFGMVGKQNKTHKLIYHT